MEDGVILEECYQMVEKETPKVSVAWLVYHVASLGTAAMCGIISEINFCHILNGFSNNCVLSPNLAFRLAVNHQYNITFPNDMIISHAGTKWNTDIVCQFCAVSWLLSFLVGTFLLVLFLACPKGGRGFENYPFMRVSRLILPALIIGFSMCVCVGISAHVTLSGLKKFCAEFETQLHTSKCTDAIDKYTIDFQQHDTYKVALSISILNLTTTTALCAWIFFVAVTLARVCLAPDYMIYYITITKVPMKRAKERTTLDWASDLII